MDQLAWRLSELTAEIVLSGKEYERTIRDMKALYLESRGNTNVQNHITNHGRK